MSVVFSSLACRPQLVVQAPWLRQPRWLLRAANRSPAGPNRPNVRGDVTLRVSVPINVHFAIYVHVTMADAIEVDRGAAITAAPHSRTATTHQTQSTPRCLDRRKRLISRGQVERPRSAEGDREIDQPIRLTQNLDAQLRSRAVGGVDMGAGQKYREILTAGTEHASQSHTVHPTWHHHIGENNIDFQAVVEASEGFFCTRCSRYFVTKLPQHLGDSRCDLVVILYKQHRTYGAAALFADIQLSYGKRSQTGF